jgi:Protein of unknown function DUF262
MDDNLLSNKVNLIEQGRMSLLEVIQLPVRNSDKQSCWSKVQRSRLIESLLINIPIPPIVLLDRSNNGYELIDGKQRIITIVNFFANSFLLEGLEFINELNGINWQNLPEKVKHSLNQRYLQTAIILENPDSEIDYTKMSEAIYNRLNS